MYLRDSQTLKMDAKMVARCPGSRIDLPSLVKERTFYLTDTNILFIIIIIWDDGWLLGALGPEQTFHLW